MAEAKDSLLDLERHRSQLEENVAKLQRALQHWQTWDAEYEALKEEVDAVCKTGGTELATIQSGFDGELVTRKEIDDIFGAKTPKSKEQILNVLDRRIDYVTKNIQSLQKQIEAAEDELAAATVISQPDATDEDGLPITEIIEQLDDDDNVVSYQLNQPGDSVPHVKEALEKAGVKDLEEGGPASQREPSQQQGSEPSQKSVSQQPAVETQPAATKEVVQPLPSASKGVSFAADTKTQDGPTPTAQVSWNARRVEEIMNHAKEQEKLSGQQPIVPDDEDEDDAELRRQMLAYSGEIGAVVAELQLEEGDSDNDDYDFEYSDEGFEDDDDDEEDKYGRSTGRVVTDGYRQRMLELEKKLGIKSRFTEKVEQEDEGESSSDDEGIGRIVVKPSPEATSSAAKPAPTKSNMKEKQPEQANGKKGVRFASNLDIAPDDEPAALTALPVREAPLKDKEPVVEPLSDVIERSGPAKTPDTKSSRKPSRFKKARNTDVPPGPLDVPAKFMDQDRPTAPTGPEGATIADTLVERELSAAPRFPDEIDDEMIHHEVADEYQRMRKKFIQREGGFLKEDESPIQPLDEADGGREKVSRFKAARLSKY
ncbi:udp-galactose transporter like [Fusarium albosuccineum]|uniref:Udp-galactose transporter like n=1 Tax=Fusarium albosuccineum TaxID=1237068 RepID=A0A8H4LAZ7_9HYPO|nr:udp-galactose transporter like [Fusarium albosuccineum]